jgi:hypothetical protein
VGATPPRLATLPVVIGSENTTRIPVICQGRRFRVEPITLKLWAPHRTWKLTTVGTLVGIMFVTDL